MNDTVANDSDGRLLVVITGPGGNTSHTRPKALGDSAPPARSANHAFDRCPPVLDAHDAGVNFLDTAERYRAEDIVGQALRPRKRDPVVIPTNTLIASARERRSPEHLVASLHASLKRLRTEWVEACHLHAVAPKHVDHAIKVLAPALREERDAGRIGHLGITETAPNDPGQVIWPKAIRSGLFDVVMVAFHLLHQNGMRAKACCRRRRQAAWRPC